MCDGVLLLLVCAGVIDGALSFFVLVFFLIRVYAWLRRHRVLLRLASSALMRLASYVRERAHLIDVSVDGLGRIGFSIGFPRHKGLVV